LAQKEALREARAQARAVTARTETRQKPIVDKKRAPDKVMAYYTLNSSRDGVPAGNFTSRAETT
jgi:hypothetical protein